VTADMLPWIAAAIFLLVLLVAVVASARAQRQLRVAHEESIATKNEQIASLETQVASLRESESIRFVDRYVAAKKGLEERVKNLSEELEKARSQQDQIRGEISDLEISGRERESESDRLQRDLARTMDQIRRLEMVLREVANVGPMDVEAIRVELDARRELSSHIRGRLERLSLHDQERLAMRQSQHQRLERLNEEVARSRRNIEITRAAASIIDGILGLDSDTRKRLAQHASEHIDSALQSLGDAARRSPISQFVEVLERQRPDRLLEGGKPTETDNGTEPPGEPRARATAPERAPEPYPNIAL
jgi:hypothetical protein